MQLLFSLTLFLSALLLFLVQPMIGKMLMPLAGGTAAVWSTCIVFFQAALLGGYVYAHAGSRGGPRRFAGTHVALLLLPLLALSAVAVYAGTPLSPIKSLAPHGQEYPFFNLVLLLAALIGLPFFFISTSAPLLQKWYADTDAPGARDPYFLYAASNLGSLIGLFLYPLVLEKYLPMRAQAWVWSLGFAGWAVLTALCWQRLKTAGTPKLAEARDETTSRPATFGEKLYWLALAAVPSSLMLSITTHATTDLAPIPLFIVVPLGLYLLTFVIAFAQPSAQSIKLFRTVNMLLFVGFALYAFKHLFPTPPNEELTDPAKQIFGLHKDVFWSWIQLMGLGVAAILTPVWANRKFVGLIAPLALLVYVFLRKTDLDSNYPLSLKIAVVVGVFFLTALNCHMELARRRPGTRYLTQYYIWMSLGGVLGGLFNSLVAPIAFNQYAEFACGLVAACFLVPAGGEAAEERPWAWLLDLLLPALLGVFVYYAIRVTDNWGDYAWLKSFHDWLEAKKSERFFHYLVLVACYGLPIMIAYVFIERPRRFGLCVAALYIGAELHNYDANWKPRNHLVQTRSFFGALQVNKVTFGESIHHKLVHGTTVHGQQQIDPPSDEPLTYYHNTGPMGDVMTRTPQGQSTRPVAFIGLGTGSLTAYAKAGQSATVYEIDPAIRRIAENPELFTYVTNARKRSAEVDIVMGDARLRLEEADDGKYAVLAVDAFSSDSIPIHLLTKEAVELYLRKTAPDGIIAIHVSNRYLQLDRVVARIAHELGMPAFEFYDNDEGPIGKSRSDWIVVAKNEAALASLLELTKSNDAKRWEPLKPDADAPFWTDDFSNVLSVYRKE